MDLYDFKAQADYWNRQAELYPDNTEVLTARVIVIADYIIQLEAIRVLNPDDEL